MVNIDNVLITGGTGTFGTSYVLKAITHGWHKKIIIFSRDEFKQIKLARYLKDKFKSRVKKASDFAIILGDTDIRFFIGDVQDYERLAVAMKGVDLVLHAAALKHVPICEYNADQAVGINILGAINVAKAAANNGVKKVVALSTDKAVDPINLYGATKLCLEKVFLGAKYYYHDDITYNVVRYGNVIASRGSIVATLLDKTKSNLYLTDPDMTRFWISIEEAIDLTRFAALNGKDNEIFIPKMKASTMQDIFDVVRPGEYVDVIGPRPGEKKHETMISEHDLYKVLDLDVCYCIPSEVKNNQPSINLSSYSSDNVEKFSHSELYNKLQATMVIELNDTLLH